jgi:hypothetical protein
MNTEQAQLFGRTRILERLSQEVFAQQPALIALIGARLTGKTTLLRALKSSHGPLSTPPPSTQGGGSAPDQRVIVLVDCAHCSLATQGAGLPAAIGEQLAAHPQRPFDRAGTGEPDDPVDQIGRVAQRLQQSDSRLVLLLDNFDHLVGNASAQLAELLSRLHSTATLVMTATQPLYDLPPPPSATPFYPSFFSGVTHYFLGLLESEAADQWLAVYERQFSIIGELREQLLDLTGQHPFLLHKLGDSLAEVQSMLPHHRLRREHLPLLGLRLAEHGRPLFVALGQQLQAPPPYLAAPTVTALIDQLLCAPIALDKLTSVQLPALNWLINQATIAYREIADGVGYQLFSPLFAEFLADQRTQLPAQRELPSDPARPPVNQQEFYAELTKIEATLLRYFQHHSHMIVSIDQLLTDVWKRPHASSRRVQEAIRRLRLQLEQHTPPIGEIKNERGRGYRFIPS